MLVALDPGHGGKDCGAVGRYGLTEAEVVLDVAERVGRLLTGDVVLTRGADIYLDLRERAVMANQAGADVFVSIHCNGFHKLAYGAETWHYPNSSGGKRLAALVQKALITHIVEANRGIKEGTFAVLQRTTRPAVLVELPFITTPEYEYKLGYEGYRQLCADGIAEGIEKYFKEE